MREETRTAQLSHVFQALSDATRLKMMERLSRGSASVSELAEPFAMALPTVMRHLLVMEDAGLISSGKQGRVRTYHMREGALLPVERWVAQRRSLWERNLDRLGDVLASEKK